MKHHSKMQYKCILKYHTSREQIYNVTVFIISLSYHIWSPVLIVSKNMERNSNALLLLVGAYSSLTACLCAWPVGSFPISSRGPHLHAVGQQESLYCSPPRLPGQQQMFLFFFFLTEFFHCHTISKLRTE